MRFCVGGASGFLGQALTGALRANGHQVVRLVRREPGAPDESSWDPATGSIDERVVERSDVVVNLGGAPFVRWPWTTGYKRRLMRSRVETTRTIASAVAAAPNRPVLLSASGINAYGDDRGAEILEESATRGNGFLSEVIHAWEEATAVASDAGARVCHLRTSAALHHCGGALRPMAVPFRLGLGGPVGSGAQYFSVISRADWVRAVEFLASHEDTHGAYNLAAPTAPTNAQFTHALASELRRPALLRAPAPVVRAAAGDLASLLLGSLRVRPARLLEAGFEFAHPDLESVIAAALR